MQMYISAYKFNANPVVISTPLARFPEGSL